MDAVDGAGMNASLYNRARHDVGLGLRGGHKRMRYLIGDRWSQLTSQLKGQGQVALYPLL